MKYKKSQFYILAVVIIIAVIAVLITTINQSRFTKEPTKFYDLSDQFSKETSQVITYGVYQKENIVEVVNNFSSTFLYNYTLEKEPNVELIFLYGNSSDIYLFNYAESSIKITNCPEGMEMLCLIESSRPLVLGNIKLDIGKGANIPTQSQGQFKSQPINLPKYSNKILIKVAEEDYEFNLKDENEQFLFIIKKNESGEIFVSGNI